MIRFGSIAPLAALGGHEDCAGDVALAFSAETTSE